MQSARLQRRPPDHLVRAKRWLEERGLQHAFVHPQFYGIPFIMREYLVVVPSSASSILPSIEHIVWILVDGTISTVKVKVWGMRLNIATPSLALSVFRSIKLPRWQGFAEFLTRRGYQPADVKIVRKGSEIEQLEKVYRNLWGSDFAPEQTWVTHLLWMSALPQEGVWKT